MKLLKSAKILFSDLYVLKRALKYIVDIKNIFQMSEIIFSLKILYLFSKLFNNKQETIVKDIILVPIQK